MNDSQSDSDDDSYYERLCAAAPGDDEFEETEASPPDSSAVLISDRVEKEMAEHEQEDIYFDRLQRMGEVESEVVLPETDPIWNILSTSLSKACKADIEAGGSARIFVSAASLVCPSVSSPEAVDRVAAAPESSENNPS